MPESQVDARTLRVWKNLGLAPFLPLDGSTVPWNVTVFVGGIVIIVVTHGEVEYQMLRIEQQPPPHRRVP